jgi:alkylhydroperoxidase family enzyme
VARHFTEQEVIVLTLAVIAINGWNRFNIAFRPEVGGYRPGMFKHMLKSA